MTPPTRQPRILIVDDHFDSRDVLTRLLARAGYQTAAAPDGPRALALASQSPPDLIILDHHMPGMTGLDVLRALRSTPATTPTPVLFYAASDGYPETDGTDGPRAQALALGATHWLQKPTTLWPHLLEHIEALAGPPPGPDDRWDA